MVKEGTYNFRCAAGETFWVDGTPITITRIRGGKVTVLVEPKTPEIKPPERVDIDEHRAHGTI